MPKLIKGGEVVEDRWTRLPADASHEEPLPQGPILVPLSLWRSRREELQGRAELGIWLQPDQSPREVAEDLEYFAVVALEFPVFTDGRGFTHARVLREQLGYRGEVRAIGAFIRDQLTYLRRCGFDAFAIETCEPEAALASLGDFSEFYQAACDQPLPLFRRRG